MAEKSIELGYWKLRGLAQPTRNLLTYLGVKFEDKQFNTPDEWQTVRATLGTDFPNLPYLKCGDKALTESEAIFLGVALNHKGEHLIGTTIEERVAITQLMGVVRDIKTNVFNIVFNPDITEVAFDNEFEKSIVPSLLKLVKRMGTNKFLNGKLSIADFFLNLILEILESYKGKNLLGKVPTLQSFLENFRSIPELKDYFKSQAFKNIPINLPDYMPKWASLN